MVITPHQCEIESLTNHRQISASMGFGQLHNSLTITPEEPIVI